MSENPPDPFGGGDDEDPIRALAAFYRELIAAERRYNERYVLWVRWSMYLIGVITGVGMVAADGWRSVLFRLLWLPALWYGLDGVAWCATRLLARIRARREKNQ